MKKVLAVLVCVVLVSGCDKFCQKKVPGNITNIEEGKKDNAEKPA
jgi:hypothetical protein